VVIDTDTRPRGLTLAASEVRYGSHFALSRALHTGCDDAKARRDIVQAQVHVWRRTHWPHIRRELESHLIRDLASIIDYLMLPL
jgi:hypothetical protein